MPKELTNTSAKNIDKNSYDLRRKSSHFLSDLMNFSEIFRKNIPFDNIKKPPKWGLYHLTGKNIFGKTKEVGG